MQTKNKTDEKEEIGRIGGVRYSNTAETILSGKTKKYKTTKATEMALMASLVNKGLSFMEIMRLFIVHEVPGRFNELRQIDSIRALTYLQHMHKQAIGFTEDSDSPGRKAALQAMVWAHGRPWPGRTGSTDRAVYLAHAEIAYRAGRMAYAASSRELGERAGVGHRTASRSTNRLVKKKLIKLDIQGGGDKASEFGLIRKKDNSDPLPVDRKWANLYSLDAFRYGGGLGKSTAAVWECLREHGPQTPKEVAERTGRCVATVRRALHRMERLANLATDQPIPMVVKVGKKWQALDVDLNEVAMVMGTDGTGEQQRKWHEWEREQRRYLREWKASKAKGNLN
jgi:hypothetical protein